jgi:hypothetical protein
MNMVPATSNGSARGERIEIIDESVLSERTGTTCAARHVHGSG